ncbi:chromate transporter [Saccharospirillum alexandrii]|uniref:chromate transporter n=1 Tax=Saccharospirillum alexandrii TaxID=2448477 RepID=UPI00373560A8
MSSTEPGNKSVQEAVASGPVPATPVPLLSLALVFLKMGALTFGGMWAAFSRIEADLVHKRGWISAETQRAMMITAALIPAPKFLAFGGMVGYRLRGFTGSVVSLVCLMIPGSLLVLAGAMLLRQGAEGTLLAAVQHSITLGIVGLLLGNAANMAHSSRLKGWRLFAGIFIAVMIPLMTLVFGVPLLVMALLGLVSGAIVIRPEQESDEHG